MGMIAARHARECVANAEIVVASEVLAAAQGLDMRAPLRPAAGTGAARDAVREVVSFLETDRELAPDVAAAVALTTGGGLVSAVEAAIGSVE
jgi:histidine ammonia-lyase